VDDVKMLPLATSAQLLNKGGSFTALYDSGSDRICVRNLPENTRQVRLFDLTGRLLQEVVVSGDIVLLGGRTNPGTIYIVQAIQTNGSARAIKVMR
jgi:hypothetical protein